jgi:hypothetical protein
MILKFVARHLYRVLELAGETIFCTVAFHPHYEAVKAAPLAARGLIAKLELKLDLTQSG